MSSLPWKFPQSIPFDSKPKVSQTRKNVFLDVVYLKLLWKTAKYLSLQTGLSPQNHGPWGTFLYSYNPYLLNCDHLPGTVLGTEDTVSAMLFGTESPTDKVSRGASAWLMFNKYLWDRGCQKGLVLSKISRGVKCYSKNDNSVHNYSKCSKI